ncbi:MAG TPA: hypothetical protein VGI45_16105 [Terracidiphilus sp.]
MSDIPLPIPPFQPMTVGQILDRVYRLLRANFSLLMGIAAVPGLVFLVGYGVLFAIWGRELISKAQSPNPAEVIRMVRLFSAFSVPVLLVCLAVFALYLAAASYAAVLADRGTGVSIGEAYRVAWSRTGHYLLLVVAIYSITFLPALLLELAMFASLSPFGANKGTPNPALILLLPFEFFLVFAFFIAGAVIALRLSLAFPASVFEVLKVKDAIKRGWTLTRGALGRIFLVVLVIYAAIYAAILILMFVAFSVAAIGFMFAGPHSHSKFAIIVAIVLGIIAYMVFIAVCTAGAWAAFTTAFAVIYNDQLFRIHGQPVGSMSTGAPI